MEIEEAIRSRKSIRAFTDQPVSQDQIQRILEISQRAPSGTNTQPWHCYVCTGEVKEVILGSWWRDEQMAAQQTEEV